MRARARVAATVARIDVMGGSTGWAGSRYAATAAGVGDLGRGLGTIKGNAVASAGAGDPSVHRPPRAPRGAVRAGGPGSQPEVVLASSDPGRLRLGRPGAVGVHRPRPGPAAR